MNKIKQIIGFEKFTLKDLWDGVGYGLLYILVALIYNIAIGAISLEIVVAVVTLGMLFMAFELQDYKQDLGLVIMALGETVAYFVLGTGSSIFPLVGAMCLIVGSIKNNTGLLKTKNRQFRTKWTHKLLFYSTVFAYVAYQHNYLVTNYIDDGTIDFSIFTTLYSCLPLAVIFSYSFYLDVFRPIYGMYTMVIVIITLQMLGTQYTDYSMVIYSLFSVAVYLKIQSRATKEKLSKDLDDFKPIKLKAKDKDKGKDNSVN